MGWERQNYKHTLILERRPGGKVKINPMMRVLTNDGMTYIEPLPNDLWQIKNLEFDLVEYVEPQVINRNDPGDLALTHGRVDRLFGGRN